MNHVNGMRAIAIDVAAALRLSRSGTPSRAQYGYTLLPETAGRGVRVRSVLPLVG